MTTWMQRLSGTAGEYLEFDEPVDAGDRGDDGRANLPNLCAPELFERQAASRPHVVALRFEERAITYGELNARANKLARHLRRRGVGPEVLVGVCHSRSPEMVVALLAVWKAGGAYVPLDPAYPPERLTFMVDDANPLVLLTEEKFCNLFPRAGATICLDSDWPEIEKEDGRNLEPLASLDNLAYVIYTSGSTGRPKGAMILHLGLANYLLWAIEAYEVKPGVSSPLYTSISFDLTVTSLFAPLLAGGMVEVLPDGFSAQTLLDALVIKGGRSLVKITPAHLQLLAAQLDPKEVSALAGAFVIGGENLLSETLALWRDSAPGMRLINEYGPTETVVGCCIYEMCAEDQRSGTVPIGLPIANTQLYVLGEDLKPVPAGVTGELYIGGLGVARGYINRPDLTAERFIEDKFSGIPGRRLYRSGDLARYREDGVLECLGRVDDQVKINGYRIELGEIEAALAGHSGIKSCVVQAREDEPGVKRLIAYFVPNVEQSAEPGELRDFLAASLPEFMVPNQFVQMKMIPLTHNGKVDRKALPVPPTESRQVNGDEAPKTPTQAAIAGLWGDLLKLEGFGINDDFFNIGGTSMAATALIQRLRTTFGVDVRLAVLFERPTIAGLAEIIDMFAVMNAKNASELGDREEFLL